MKILMNHCRPTLYESITHIKNKKVFPLCILFFTLSLSSTHVFAQALGQVSSNVNVPGDCCNRWPLSEHPCTEVNDINQGSLYLKLVILDISAGVHYPLEVNSLSMDIGDPNGQKITPHNVEYFYTDSTGIGAPVSFPISVPINTTLELVAEIQFHFSPNSSTPVLTGTYEFSTTSTGDVISSPIAPFSLTSAVYQDVKDDEECTNEFNLIEISGPRDRITAPSSNQAQWIPNPTQAQAILSLDLATETQISVEIMNMQGQIVLQPIIQQSLPAGIQRRKLNVSKLPAGIYYTRIRTGTNVQVIKWVKLE